MKEALISVTAAARKFSDCINRVRYQGISFLLEKNGVPVARIIPVQPDFGSDFERIATTLRQAQSPEPEIGAEDRQLPLHETGGKESDSPNTSDLKRPRFNW